MRKYVRLATVCAPLVLIVACATPDTAARNVEEANEAYARAVAHASAWDTTVWGLPASGALALAIAALCALVAVVCAVCVTVYKLKEENYRRAQSIHAKNCELERIAIERGSCTMCGHDPRTVVGVLPEKIKRHTTRGQSSL